jgi:hypothetical protein
VVLAFLAHHHPVGEPADGGAVLGLCALVLIFLLIAGGKKKK